MTTVRIAKLDDAGQFTEWSLSTRQNGLDADIADYATLRALAIEKEGQPILYIPFHVALVIESAACKPGITGREYIEGLLAAKEATEAIARQYGIREIHTSSTYAPMIKTLTRHGYSPIVGTALRKKLC